MKKLLYSFFAIYITCTAKAQDAVDIWNLPPLNVEQGRYTTDWDNLSRQYNTPSWWREAKLGAWSHWDPQSMAEDGDWYSRGSIWKVIPNRSSIVSISAILRSMATKNYVVTGK